jgi:hypothetical protein
MGKLVIFSPIPRSFMGVIIAPRFAANLTYAEPEMKLIALRENLKVEIMPRISQN